MWEGTCPRAQWRQHCDVHGWAQYAYYHMYCTYLHLGSIAYPHTADYLVLHILLYVQYSPSDSIANTQYVLHSHCLYDNTRAAALVLTRGVAFCLFLYINLKHPPTRPPVCRVEPPPHLSEHHLQPPAQSTIGLLHEAPWRVPLSLSSSSERRAITSSERESRARLRGSRLRSKPSRSNCLRWQR